jgi:hypothetical protein
MIKKASWLVLLLCVFGCSGEDDQGVHRAGKRVGETLTEFAQGVGSGIDNKLEEKVELTEPVAALGLESTVAKADGYDDSGKKLLTVYLIASRSVNQWLMAKAMNREGQEVGRTTVEVIMEADDAKYVTFAFDPGVDMQNVEKYELHIGKPQPSPQPESDGAGATGKQEETAEEVDEDL